MPGFVEPPPELGRNAVAGLESILEPGIGDAKVPGVGKAVRASEAALGQLETVAEGLADVATCGAVEQRHGEAQSPGHDDDLTRSNHQDAGLRQKVETARLRHN